MCKKLFIIALIHKYFQKMKIMEYAIAMGSLKWVTTKFVLRNFHMQMAAFQWLKHGSQILNIVILNHYLIQKYKYYVYNS